ncbi:DHS-like NAD/FAD-binding domain-containing protein [Sistotremastrum suecicum HHB10207 ss-3]|uniref:DHS-like NAD/FAD-binding domain-containing protein n=1 Tax=Sistotremastrum suecicum HHB10207 ss-3 TaxID=1314776 RepID=A0A166BPD4_9AGAM|nr:DHS-like NAD/FAD-binding domain-containing protein [Sistotremastrum suecicum HHB10207 ss-3]
MTVTLDLAESSTDQSTRRTLTNLSLAVAKSRKIIVVTGAGISCSSGIPDFRSSDGLYNLVKSKYPNAVLKGRDLFDSSLFRDPTSTSLFYTFISELKRSIDGASPSPTHKFLETLRVKNKLLRSYTQNIDGFEARVGLKSKGKMNEIVNVQLHGDIHRVRCSVCSTDIECSPSHLSTFLDGEAPDCPDCAERSEVRVASSRRALKIGTLRPAIVLYDEPHPQGDLIGKIQTKDLSQKPDLLIIMGTSLKVFGLKKLAKEFAKVVHASSSKNGLGGGKVIFVNKTAPGSEWKDIIDYHVQGNTDDWVERVEREWRKAKPSHWETQTTLSGLPSMKVVKSALAKSKGMLFRFQK